MRSISLSLLFFLFLGSHFVMAQNSDFVMDERDGNIYLVAKFNATWWMCQNLKYDIKEGTGCYEDDETNCMLKGRLYTQAAAQLACPEGYHLPSDDDWKALESYIGMQDDELNMTFNRNSGTVGKFLRMGGGLSFDADYVGMMNPKGNSSFEGSRAYFWTSSENEHGMGWIRIIDKNRDGVERQALDKNNKLTVRCVKEGVAEPKNKTEAEPKSKQQKEQAKQKERGQGQNRPDTRPPRQKGEGKEGKEKNPD